jgi:hypothetical protein
MWDLCPQTAKCIKRPMDLGVRLSALRHVQLNCQTRQTAVSPPRNCHHHFQITIQFIHRRQASSRLMLPLRLQKQLRLIQKPLANRRCSCSPGGI